MILVSASQMREMDRKTIEDFGLPGMVLMETAARGAIDALYAQVPGLASKSIAVFAGKGNNGGDGFVMARWLLAQGAANVRVYLLANREDIKGDARTNLELLYKMGAPVIELPDQAAFGKKKKSIASHGVWIDAILGTGLASPLEGYFKAVVEFLNQQPGVKFAVDIPSGLFADTGQGGVVFKADATATMGAVKIGMAQEPGASLCGKITVVDIGIPPHVTQSVKPDTFLLSRQNAAQMLPRRDLAAHKGNTGHVLVVAGSPGKTGAAALAANAAMRAGAGLVTVATPKSLGPVAEALAVEPMTLYLPETGDHFLGEDAAKPLLAALEGKVALALGPGLGTGKQTEKLVGILLEKAKIPIVADADALNCLAKNPGILKKVKAPVILTPHPGEMARLSGLSTGQIQSDRIQCARDFAVANKVHLVLKGARTVIAHPDSTVFVNPTGNSGMASGGMGDVLTGVIAAFIAQGCPPENAARLGVYLHGLAADSLYETKGPFGYTASDVGHALPGAILCLAKGDLA